MKTDLEGAHEGLIDTHHSSSVIKFSTVVRSREESDQLTLGKELIAVLYHLSITRTTYISQKLNHLSDSQTYRPHILTLFIQLILWKISKTGATKYQILRVKLHQIHF